LRDYRSCGRLNFGDRDRFSAPFASGGVLLVLHDAFRHHTFQEERDGAFALGGLAYFGAWGEDAEFGVGGDLFDDFDRFRFGIAMSGGPGKVEAGDLEAVEEQTGAAGVDVVGGDAAEDFADGLLDGGTVFWEWDFEGGAAASAGARMWRRFSGVVVVVAEIFSAQAWTAAAMAIGKDVAALVLFGCFGCVLHGPSPRGTFFVQSLRTRRDESGLPVLSSLACG
jgi:hypothetical protein